MRKTAYLLILVLLFISCGSNDFIFDEKKQSFEANSTYFGFMEIRGLDNDDCFIIKRRANGRKERFLILNEIPESYYILHCSSTDTINNLNLRINSEYEIINRGVYNAAPDKIILITDEKGVLHQKE